MLAERIASWTNRKGYSRKQERSAENANAYAVIPETANQDEFVAFDAQSDNKAEDIITRYQYLEPKNRLVLAEIANTDTLKTFQAQCQSMWPDASEDDVKALQKHLRVK